MDRVSGFRMFWGVHEDIETGSDEWCEYWQARIDDALAGDNEEGRHLLEICTKSLELFGQLPPPLLDYYTGRIFAALDANARGVIDALGISKGRKGRPKGTSTWDKQLADLYVRTKDSDGKGSIELPEGCDKRTYDRWLASNRRKIIDMFGLPDKDGGKDHD